VERGALPNASFVDVDHYVAEFLFQNPDVRYWEVDERAQRIRRVEPPTVPSDAVRLPAPSGGDDTAALERAINSGPGKSFVARSGDYRVSGLDITASQVSIFGLSMVPTSNTGVFVNVRGDGIKFFNAKIDAQKQGSVYQGWLVTGDGFHLVSSEFSNMHSTANRSGGAVTIKRSAGDYFLSGNTINYVVNASGPSATHRANPFWISGGNDSAGNRVPSGGGYIVNNTAQTAQSNGDLVDADFITFQTHGDYRELVRIFGNRFVDAGKRFLKVQSSGVIALSNQIEWREIQGPIARYKRLHVFSLQFGFQKDFAARNNRIYNNNDRNWTGIFNVSPVGSNHGWDNIHFDSNYIEINNRQTNPRANYDRYIMLFVSLRNASLSASDTSAEATNTTAKDNVIAGSGAPRYNYWFGDGWDLRTGSVDVSGNQFRNEPTAGIERRQQ